jgi:hypothetical protein
MTKQLIYNSLIMTIYLEKEWEALDIIEYCSKKDIKCIELSAEQLSEMDSSQFCKYPSFCNTTIVQKHLLNMNKTIIDTYPDILKSFYKRNISKYSADKITNGSLNLCYPYFIKSVGNTKELDGTIINAPQDLDILFSQSLNREQYNDTLYYVSNYVIFISEYRLLIGNNTIYGVGHQKDKKIDIDNKFIDDILKTVLPNDFMCIDVGFIKNQNEWAIVEVNPPFSLDDYGIDIDSYMQFCIDSHDSLQFKPMQKLSDI